MNNRSQEKQQTDIHQTVTNHTVNGPDSFEEADQTVYRYVKIATETEVPANRVHLDSPDIHQGDVVEIDLENGRKDYFSVDHIVAGEIPTVYLIRARNSLWKSLLLLAVLGISWYVIDFLLKHIF